MKRFLLLFFLVAIQLSYAQNTNLVFNGDMEDFSYPDSTPNGWSSASDFGDFNQNTTDFSEGASSVQFTPGFSELMMFTTVAIPLEAGKTYVIKYSYKYLGTTFGYNNNISFQIYHSSGVQFQNSVNIVDNLWNTVELQYTPTESDDDAEVTFRVYPNYNINVSKQNSAKDLEDEQYSVLIDDVQIYEATDLSNHDFNLEDNISIYTLKDKQFEIKKSSNITITDVSLFSILGQQQKLNINSNEVLNLNTFSTGIYILKVSTNNGNITKKIFVK